MCKSFLKIFIRAIVLVIITNQNCFCNPLVAREESVAWKSMDDVLRFSRFEKAPSDQEIDTIIDATVTHFASNPAQGVAIIWKANYLCGSKLMHLQAKAIETINIKVNVLKSDDRCFDIRFAEVLWDSLQMGDNIQMYGCIFNQISELLKVRQDSEAETLKTRIKETLSRYRYNPDELMDF